MNIGLVHVLFLTEIYLEFRQRCSNILSLFPVQGHSVLNKSYGERVRDKIYLKSGSSIQTEFSLLPFHSSSSSHCRRLALNK